MTFPCEKSYFGYQWEKMFRIPCRCQKQIRNVMFLGSFNYSIDAKGRISIPVKLRKFVSPDANDTFVLTRGSSQCINIYPMNYWKELVESKLDRLNTFDPKEGPRV